MSTLSDLLARLDDIPPDPLNGARTMTCHPDRIEELRQKLGVAAEGTPPYTLQLLTLVASSFAPKNLGFLSDDSNRLVGVYNFADGQFSFFEPIKPPRFVAEFKRPT